MKHFAKMKRLLALILCVAMCMGMYVPAYAASASSVSLSLSPNSIEASSTDQTVTLDIKTTEQVSVDSLMYTVEVPTGFTVAEPVMPNGITGITWVNNQLIWYSTAADVTGLTNLGSIEITVPANTDPGSYEIKVTGFDASANAVYWVEQASYSTTLTIKAPEVAATGISLNKDTLALKVGGSETLTATVEPTNSTDEVVWSSSDEDVATVKDGVVTAKAIGTATITAKAGGAKDTCTVTVACAHTNKTTHTAENSTCKVQGWDAYSECECGQLFNASGNEIIKIPYRPLSTNHTGGTATCEEKAICSVCGQPYGNFADHPYGDLIAEKAATHTSTTLEAGMKAHYKCSVCGNFFDEDQNPTTEEALIIAAPTHTYDQKKVEAAYLKSAATCTDAAVYYKSCICGAKSTEEFTHGSANGHSMTATPANEPTCTADGNKAYWTCGTCGNVYADAEGNNQTTVAGSTLPMKEHTPVWNKDNTHHWQECSVETCKAVIEGTKKEHTYPDTWTNNSAAGHNKTCTEGNCAHVLSEAHTFNQRNTDSKYLNGTADCQNPASYFYSCVCGEKGTDTWDSDTGNHKLEQVPATPVTCTEDGNIAYYRCTVDGCGKYFSDDKGETEIELSATIIPKTGHSMTETPAKGPTCEEDGTQGYFTCSNSCGKVYKDRDGTIETTVAARAIPKLGHKFDDDAVKGPTTLKAAATCKAPAEYWYTCSNENCDEISTEGYYTVGGVAPHSTENTKKTEAKAETCTVDGIVAHWDCTNCGKIFADNDGALGEEITEADTVIKAHGHTEATSWSTDDETHWKVCVCEKGCSDKCGIMIASTEAAHDWVKQDSSTETRNDFKCSVCEATKSEDLTVEKPSAPSVDRDDRDDDEDDDRISSSDVKDAFEDAKGDKVTINLGDDEEISKRVFTELQKDPDMTVVLKGDGYSWTFDGSNIDGNIKSAYFDASVRNSTPKAKAIKKLTGNADIQHVHLGHTGDLPGVATLTVVVDKDLRSEPINVYFYNAETKTLELVASGFTAKNGKVSFALSEGGDYILTNDTFGTAAEKVNPKTGALDLSVAAFAVVAMAGCAAVGFKKK